MILAALLLTAAQAVDPGPALTPEEVTVIGARMRRVKFDLKYDRKADVWQCRFKKRSFDPSFDAHFCEIARGCARISRRKADLNACMKPPVEAYARELTARLKAAGVRQSER